MNWLVDDQQLGAILRTGAVPSAVGGDDEIHTTGYWYVRLCLAVLGAAERGGVLSGPFDVVDPVQRERATAALMELPDEIGLVSLRVLAPLIGRLRARHRLNALASEALAASVYLGASVILSAPSPLLESALADEGCAVVRT